MRTRPALAAVALVLAATACGSDPQPAAAPSPPPATSSAAPSPAPTSADETLPFGDSFESSGGEAVSTVYGYQQPVARSAPRPEQRGYEWAAVDVKVCVKKDFTEAEIVVSDRRWVLVYDDDTQIEVSSTGYEAHPKPKYPWEKVLAPGRCVRGWITYAVPAGKRPVAVEYVASSERVPPRWAIE